MKTSFAKFYLVFSFVSTFLKWLFFIILLCDLRLWHVERKCEFNNKMCSNRSKHFAHAPTEITNTTREKKMNQQTNKQTNRVEYSKRQKKYHDDFSKNRIFRKICWRNAAIFSIRELFFYQQDYYFGKYALRECMWQQQ